MTEPKPTFFTRLFLAFSVFWRILVDSDFANAVLRLRRGPESPAAGLGSEQQARAVPPLLETGPASALQLLGLLQQEGRFIDFIAEDVAGYSDADVGAAVRVVHEGCRKVLQEHFPMESVRGEEEGRAVTLEAGFDASAIRITGNVVGKPPFRGTLVHRGWRVTEVHLPKLARGHEVEVLAPAEVEL